MLVIIAGIGGGVWTIVYKVQNSVQQVADTSKLSTTDPDLKISDVVEDLNNPVSVVFPTQTAIAYGVHGGEVRGRLTSTNEDWPIFTPANIRTTDGFGLFSLLSDKDFADKRYLYACYATGSDVRLTRYEIAKDLKSVIAVKDILTGIEVRNSNNTSCALAMDAAGTIWIGTGDSGIPTASQNPKSLAGKILRISRDGIVVGGNQKAPYDDRIFSYGHNKVTSIVLIGKLLDNLAYGYAVDQGSESDELNYLRGGNFGYDPNTNGTYATKVIMTDKTKFKDAIDPVWNTGDRSIGLQGAVLVKPERWQAWQNKLLITATQFKESRIIELDDAGAFKSEKTVLQDKTGRISNLFEAPDGTLYATTDNDTTDKIIQIKVVCTVCY